MQNYLKGVESFINFILSNSKNISGDEIRCSSAKYKNKKFHHKVVVMIHLLKNDFAKKYLCWFTHYKNHMFLMKPCLKGWLTQLLVLEIYMSSQKIIIIFYRSMIMDAMRMNHDYSGEGSCNISLDEEPNINRTRFFELLM
jgi:hypothetical protein